MELKELARWVTLLARGMIVPDSQHLVHTIANKIALSPSQEFCEFPDGLLDCEAVSELYLSCW